MNLTFRFIVFLIITAIIGYCTRFITHFVAQTIIAGFATFLASLIVVGWKNARRMFVITVVVVGVGSLAYMLNIIHPK